MSVVEVADVQYESWGGYADPRLPQRVWKGRVTAAGDVSGGTVSMFLRFNLAGGERLDTHFSLEEFFFDSGALTTAFTGTLEARNFGSVQTGTRPIKNTFTAIAITAGGTGMNPAQRDQNLPLFLGAQVFRSTLLELVVIFPNTNGVTSNVWFGGYAWGPRSVSAPNGGIIRPVPGLFTQ